MNAGQARAIASQWVSDEAARFPGEVLAAFTWGSVNWMADEDAFPASSDLDIAVVVPNADPERHQVRKRPYRGLTVEPFYVARERMMSAEVLLADYAFAPNVVHGKVLLDPARFLAGLRAAMAPEYPRRSWIRQRCRSQRDEALRFLGWADQSDRFLFLNGVVFHTVQNLAQMALIADLRNPTVKKALVKAREVLTAHGLAEDHQRLLRLLGAAELDGAAILMATAHCRRALDEACRWRRTPFGADNQVTEHSRSSLDLDVPARVADGTGREMLLWVAFLHTISMMAIHNDAPAEVEAAAWYVYVDDMAPLGLTTMDEARARLAACRQALVRMVEVCDDVIARHPRAIA